MPGRDAAERAQLLRIAVLLGGPLLIIGAFTLYFAASRLKLPTSVVLACLALLLPATWGAILLVEAATARSAHGLVTALHAAHARAPLQGFSRQEALVAQGRPDEAVTAYRQRLMESPGDVRAMIALARLLGGPLGDAEGAETLYQRARAETTGPAWERVITDDLIDLYDRMGMDGKLRTELARFAELHRGTQAGNAARAQLDRLKIDPPQEG